MRTGHLLDSWAHPSGKLIVLYEVRDDQRLIVRDTVMIEVYPGEAKAGIAKLIQGFIANVANGLTSVNGIAETKDHRSRAHGLALDLESFECPPLPDPLPPWELNPVLIPLSTPEREMGAYRVMRDEFGLTWLIKDERIAVAVNSKWVVDLHRPVFDRIDKLGPGSRILMIGLGLGVLIEYCRENKNVAEIDVIERCEEVIELAAITDKRVTIHRGDAKELHLKGHWNIVWVDLWDDIEKGEHQDWAAIARAYAPEQAEWVGHTNARDYYSLADGAVADDSEALTDGK